MRTHEFTIVASGLDPEAADFEDRFFEAGCDDATIAFARGAIMLGFAREAANLRDAVESAVADVRRAGAIVHRIEPDPLVSLSEIAERAGLTRAATSLYAKGARGRGFPRPVARATTESPLWDWTEVSDWLRARNLIGDEAASDARILRAANDLLVAAQRREPA